MEKSYGVQSSVWVPEDILIVNRVEFVSEQLYTTIQQAK